VEVEPILTKGCNFIICSNFLQHCSQRRPRRWIFAVLTATFAEVE
jgi:hypothetical protein